LAIAIYIHLESQAPLAQVASAFCGLGAAFGTVESRKQQSCEDVNDGNHHQ
jgi:hypothetical protein